MTSEQIEAMIQRDARSARFQSAVRTHEEVAQIMGISKQAVETTEKRALGKLRKHPAIIALAQQCGVTT